jgi:hypothetical protein
MLTIEQWISLLGGIATAGAAWATFRTVHEVKKQREASYKPDIVPRRQYAYAFREAENPHLIFQWSDERPSAEAHIQTLERPKHPGYRLSLLNVGLGAAKAIRATWSIDLTSWTQEIHALAKSNGTDLVITHGANGQLRFSGPEFVFSVTQLIENQFNFEVDHLLPASLDRVGLSIQVPDIYLMLAAIQVSLGARLGTARGINDPWSSLPTAHLSLSFTDIGGERHRRSFDCRFELLGAGHENIGFHAGEWPTFLMFIVRTIDKTSNRAH